jgi:hypothetical protein
VQYQGVKGNALDQFREMGTQIVLEPIKDRTGAVLWPYR